MWTSVSTQLDPDPGRATTETRTRRNPPKCIGAAKHAPFLTFGKALDDAMLTGVLFGSVERIVVITPFWYHPHTGCCSVHCPAWPHSYLKRNTRGPCTWFRNRPRLGRGQSPVATGFLRGPLLTEFRLAPSARCSNGTFVPGRSQVGKRAQAWGAGGLPNATCSEAVTPYGLACSRVPRCKLPVIPDPARDRTPHAGLC